MYEIRKDYLGSQYVLISSKETARRVPIVAPLRTTSCALCPTRLDATDSLYRFPEYGDWHMNVVANTQSAVFLPRTHEYNVQEMMVEVPEHGLHLENLPEEHIARIFEAYATRLQHLAESKKIKHAVVFKNAGGPMSQLHAHSQLFASDKIPVEAFEHNERVRQYRKDSGRCLFCDVTKEERKSDRLVYEDAFVTVFTPFAPHRRYEVYVMPRRHLSSMSEFSHDERHSIAGALRRLFRKITSLGLPSHFSLKETFGDQNQHVFLNVAPRDHRAFATHSGLILNPVSPERAAAFYRE